jgi:hypothetical protein
MNVARVALAGLGAFVAYFVFGGAISLVPSLRDAFRAYPNVYRTQESMKQVMPGGMVAMFVAIRALAALYAGCSRVGGVADGARFGALIGVFVVAVQ